MKTLVTFLALTLGATIATGTPALAVSQPSTYTFRTDFTDIRGLSAGAYEGVLNIRIAHDGTIQGLYRNEDGSHEQFVTGGLRGNQVWLQIGDQRITGTYAGGKIEGTTQLEDGSFGGELDGYQFEAVPVTPQL